jgi:hypothetical protein
MAKDPNPNPSPTPNPASGDTPLRNRMAMWILIASAAAITLLAIVAVIVKPSEAQVIFNTTLPVFASWVGTVLAYYFGRENFESANSQVRQMIDKLSPEQRAAAPIDSIMRKLDVTTHVKLPGAQGEAQVPLTDLRTKLVGDVSRLPVVDPSSVAKYMIHGSTIDRYLAGGGKETDTLAAFIAECAKNGTAFDAGRGFVLAAAKDTIQAAKEKLDRQTACQDIFITADGKPDQPLLGWVSNVRLGKFLQT